MRLGRALSLGLLAMALAVAALVIIDRSTPADVLTPDEQARRLRGFAAYDIGPPNPLRFSRWTGPTTSGSSATVTAIYGGGDFRFEMTVYANEDAAESAFRAGAEAIGRDEVQQINAFGGKEYCARLGARVECVGVEPQARLFLHSEGPVERGNLEEELDVLLLLRTARKHWFRVYPDFVVTPE